MYTYAISVPDAIVNTPECLAALSKAKLNRIEYSCSGWARADRMPQKVAELAEAQAAGGVCVKSIHIPFGANWEFSSPYEVARKAAAGYVRDFIEVCAPLGCRNFTMHSCLEPIPLEPGPRAEHIQAFRRTMADLIPVAQKHGIHLNIEDLPRSCLGNSIEELQEMLDGLPLETIGVCFDVNHFCNCPERLVEGIRTFSDRIRAFHLSDYDGIDECHWYPGFGVIDWSAIMDAIRQLPHDVILIFEAYGFLNGGRRAIAPDIILKSFERNVFELENAAEIRCRIAAQIIP